MFALECDWPQALLHEEMENLKRRRAELKRESKQAAKDQKLLAAKRQRLLKVYRGYCQRPLNHIVPTWQAAKGLSAADLQLLLQRAQGWFDKPSCWLVLPLVFAAGGGGAGGVALSWQQFCLGLGLLFQAFCQGADPAGGAELCVCAESNGLKENLPEVTSRSIPSFGEWRWENVFAYYNLFEKRGWQMHLNPAAPVKVQVDLAVRSFVCALCSRQKFQCVMSNWRKRCPSLRAWPKFCRVFGRTVSNFVKLCKLFENRFFEVSCFQICCWGAGGAGGLELCLHIAQQSEIVLKNNQLTKGILENEFERAGSRACHLRSRSLKWPAFALLCSGAGAAGGAELWVQSSPRS